jgi:hypothetical protein
MAVEEEANFLVEIEPKSVMTWATLNIFKNWCCHNRFKHQFYGNFPN